MTLTTLVGPSAVLISKEVLTVGGTYSRTPPAGAAYVAVKLRPSGGAATADGASGKVAYAAAGPMITGLIAVSSNDSLSLIVGAGATQSDGGALTSIALNGATLVIAGAGGGAIATASYDGQSGASASAGAGGIASGNPGYFYSSASGGDYAAPNGNQGSGATSTTDGLNGGRQQAHGGTGYHNGGAGSNAGGGANSFVDANVTHVATYLPQSTKPANPSDPDLGASVGAPGYTHDSVNQANGNDGGVALAWYTGDPYAAGLLS